MHQEQILWAQKAKINWDLNGDCNNKYFQTLVKNRRRHNWILQIKNEQDIWTSNQAEIQQVFLTFFQQLFNQPPNEVQD